MCQCQVFSLSASTELKCTQPCKQPAPRTACSVALRVIGSLVIVLSLHINQAFAADPRVTSAVIHELAAATTKMASRQQVCRELEIILPSGLLDHLALSDEEKKTSLLYFRSRASWECEKHATLELLAATQMARHVGLPYFSHADDPQNLAANIQLMGYESMLRYRGQFQGLPASKRIPLERLDALQQPFKLLESAWAVGLSAPEENVAKAVEPDKGAL